VPPSAKRQVTTGMAESAVVTASPRVSVVDFTNAWPLTAGFLDGSVPSAELHRDKPSRCAERLAAGEVDAGLVPVVALAGLSGHSALRGLGIAAKAAVRSVLLVSSAPPDRIDRLALDPASRTSVLLARLLLQERWGRRPEIVEERRAEARVVIGDPALAVDPRGAPGAPFVVDLAAVWADWTGLPFVFAVWGVRDGVDPAPFRASRERGRACLPELVEMAAARTGLAVPVLEDYLGRRLFYDLGESEEAGAAEFLARAARAGLLPADRITWRE
jgi:chorismate dehydratase